MSSFTRADYRALYEYARTMAIRARVRSEFTHARHWAEKAEGVLGQIDSRPASTWRWKNGKADVAP
jgi:hypothetical protein